LRRTADSPSLVAPDGLSALVLDWTSRLTDMTPLQSRNVVLLTVGLVVLWVVLPFVGGSRVEPPPLSTEAGAFDGQKAFDVTREFVTSYPKRVTGSLESRQASGFLQHKLQSLGYSVSYTHFDVVIGRTEVARNVLAFRPGASQEIVAVLAHYDTARTTLQGAMDDGSGVGTLLELARLFSTLQLRRGLLLVATDAEEWGMLGARNIAAGYPERRRIVAALSLDAVAPGALGRLSIDSVGQLEGYSPAWLRALVRAACLAEGAEVEVPFGFREQMDRALLISLTDQGPLLSVGIPAVNIGSLSVNQRLESDIYHSPRDTIENMRPESFTTYGKVVERAVRSLDALSPVPSGNGSTFLVTPSRSVSARIMAILHWLSLIPVGVAFFLHVRNQRAALTPGRVLRELLALGCTFLPFLSVPYVLGLLSRMRLLPRYSLYPATPKDPVLENPAVTPLATVLIIFALLAIACYFTARFAGRRPGDTDFFASKIVLMALLLATAVLGLLYNPYWAATFVFLPAWVWSLVEPGQGFGGRLANRLIVLVSGVVYFATTWAWASNLQLGWKILWYELLAIHTGLFRTEAYLLACLAFAVGIRFLAIQSHPSREGTPQ
jgi:hypothetical protein